MSAVSLGPFAIGLDALLIALVFGVASITGWLAARGQRVDVGAALIAMLWAGLLAARAAFVIEWFREYRAEPWTMLDIRDGGFTLWAGIAGALAAGGWYAGRSVPLRKPLAIAVASGGVAWILLAMLPRPASGPTLPAAELERLEGGRTSLAALGAGRPTVVNLWATWCPPCRREMPILAEAQRRDADVRYVFVDQGEDAARVKRYLDKEVPGLQDVLLDPDNRIGRETSSPGLPTTLFYDSAGRLVDTHVGALSAASLAAKLEVARRVPRETARKPAK